MERITRINVPYQSNANTPAKIDGLPGEGKLGPYYLKKIFCRLNLVLVSAGVSDAVTGRRMVEAINALNFKPKVGPALIENVSGAAFRWLQRTLTLRAPLDPSNIAVNSNVTNSKTVLFEIPFADKRAKEPMDSAQPMAWLADGAFTVKWVLNSYFGAGQVIDTSTSLDLFFVYDDLIETHQAGFRVQYAVSGLAKLLGDTLPASCITDLLLTQNNGGASFAETDFGDVRSDIDSEVVLDSIDPDAIIDTFNSDMIEDEASFCPVFSDTTPEEFPLIWPKPRNYDMKDVGVATQRFKHTFENGSAPPDADTLQYAVRRYVAQDVMDIAAQGSTTSEVSSGTLAQGLDHASKLSANDAQHLVKIPTNNDVPLSGVKAALWGPYLPRRINPGGLKAVAQAAASSAPVKG